MKEKDRFLLQSIGTKMREINPDVWVNSTLCNLHENVIIDDARFTNEIQKLKHYDFILIKLDISKELQLKRLKDTYKDTWNNHNLLHESENEIELFNNNIFDIIINVDSFISIEKITNYVFNILEKSKSNLVQQ